MLEYNESPYVSTIRTKGNTLIMRCPDFQVANNGTTKKCTCTWVLISGVSKVRFSGVVYPHGTNIS